MSKACWELQFSDILSSPIHSQIKEAAYASPNLSPKPILRKMVEVIKITLQGKGKHTNTDRNPFGKRVVNENKSYILHSRPDRVRERKVN